MDFFMLETFKSSRDDLNGLYKSGKSDRRV